MPYPVFSREQNQRSKKLNLFYVIKSAAASKKKERNSNCITEASMFRNIFAADRHTVTFCFRETTFLHFPSSSIQQVPENLISLAHSKVDWSENYTITLYGRREIRFAGGKSK